MELPLNDFYGLPLTVFKRNRIKESRSRVQRESWLDFFFIGFGSGSKAEHRIFIFTKDHWTGSSGLLDWFFWTFGLGFLGLLDLVFQDSWIWFFKNQDFKTDFKDTLDVHIKTTLLIYLFTLSVIYSETIHFARPIYQI
jgi:hypothetical protein